MALDDQLDTGRHLTAEEAERFGLIGHVVDDGSALDKALEIAELIAANGPLAVAATKRNCTSGDSLVMSRRTLKRSPHSICQSGSSSPGQAATTSLPLREMP